MKKLLFLSLVFLAYQGVRSQEIYLQTGKNYTQYDYKSDTNNPPSLLNFEFVINYFT